VVKPETTTIYLIGVDSNYEIGDSYGQGNFTLTVEKVDPPPHDTCGNAQLLTFIDNKVEVSGSTLAGADEVNLTSSDCTGNTTYGPDVFIHSMLQKV